MDSTHPSAEHSPCSLLIVEDEASLRHAMIRRFEGRGYRVHSAASIAEARRKLQVASFDVFVFDVGLPDGDGLALLEGERASRTLVISGEAQTERLAESGVEHFLAKPFDLSEATRRVEALYQSAGTSRMSAQAAEVTG